jgi:putative DNA primase/helicase
MHGAIDFKSIASAALACSRSLLLELLPDGHFKGDEYIVKNPLRNDQNPGSFSINSKTGIWKDFATGKKGGGDLIALVAYLRGSTQLEAARELVEKVGVSVPELSAHSGTKEKDAESWTIVMPVPAGVPGPNGGTHPELGQPTKAWPYRNAAGDLIGYILRFDGAKGKEFRPLILWRNSINDRLDWRWKSWPPKRPLYGLPELAKRSSAIVVVCEGEKAADAARRLLPDFVWSPARTAARVPTRLTGRRLVDAKS